MGSTLYPRGLSKSPGNGTPSHTIQSSCPAIAAVLQLPCRWRDQSTDSQGALAVQTRQWRSQPPRRRERRSFQRSRTRPKPRSNASLFAAAGRENFGGGRGRQRGGDICWRLPLPVERDSACWGPGGHDSVAIVSGRRLPSTVCCRLAGVGISKRWPHRGQLIFFPALLSSVFNLFLHAGHSKRNMGRPSASTPIDDCSP